ncbi:MAG: hypothetical protein ABIZ49_09500 [Opitutaceae bacterium]
MERFYELVAAAWQATAAKPERQNLALLLEGTRRFPRNLDLVFQAAQLHAYEGYTPEAATLIRAGLEFAPDEKAKERFVELDPAKP